MPLAALILALTLPAAIVSAQTAPRMVNVTTDSAPGWIPSEDLERQALAAMNAYFSAVDSGRFRDAFGAMAPLSQSSTPYADFEKRSADFRNEAGAPIRRRVMTITWTKDPANAPIPGTYVAIDISARYVKIARQCGYIVLYQAPSGGSFRVMRTENNYLSDAAAAKMTPAEVDRAWQEATAYCPNYSPEP
jgi:hypothetical protein